MKKLITHNGSFHADDIFAAATLSIWLEKKGEKFEIIRTRDEEIIKAGDYVFDVGGVYDAEKNRFDHHQSGGAGHRASGIEYASFGLVWQKSGSELCGEKKIAEILDKKLVAPIDAFDNGIALTEKRGDIAPYLLQDLFLAMRPTWREDVSPDNMFLKSVDLAKEILMREIIQTQDALQAEEKVLQAYAQAEDKHIIVLDDEYPYQEALAKFPEVLFVIYPKKANQDWRVKALRKGAHTFENRKDFPKEWAGLCDTELQKVSGVNDATFCHRGLFLAVAKSKEGALALAKKALV